MIEERLRRCGLEFLEAIITEILKYLPSRT